MRLIDADELIPSLKMGEVNADTAYGDGRNGGIYFAIWRIGQMSTVDAVEVVRCRECVHYIKHDKRCGIWNHGGVVPYGFCFLGERRQG